MRFDLENVTYAQAMPLLLSMTHAFAVPVDSTTLLIADDDPAKAHRQQMERQLQETIEMPGATNDRLNELANVVRNIFGVKQATVQIGLGTIVVRAPEDVLTPLNQVLAGLMEPAGEVLFDVKLYEMDNTRTAPTSATALPSQFSAFNVDAEATNIVNSNQTLVQQAIAQGYIPANASNLTIALDLIGAGLVQSSLASNLVGTIGGGALRTGISGFHQHHLQPGPEFQRRQDDRRYTDADWRSPGGDLPGGHQVPDRLIQLFHRRCPARPPPPSAASTFPASTSPA